MHIGRSAEDIAYNRARYEEHQRKGLEFAPKALPTPSPLPAPLPDVAAVLHREVVPAGWYWSTRVKAGETLRIAQEGRVSLALIAWNADDTSERINLPDTVKMQWTTGLSKGRVIFSDMGRVMFSLTEDSCGAHDCLAGVSTAAGIAARYPGAAEKRLRNGRDNFIIIAEKLGLDRRDIPAALTLFAPLRVDDAGRFEWRPELLNGNDYVDLRAEMDMIVAFSNTPHPFDPAPDYPQDAVAITRLKAAAVAADDLCRTATAEAVRGFENNAFAAL